MQYFSMANSYWGAVNQSFGKSWDFGPIGWSKSESLLPPHSGQKSRFLAPQDIPDISGYQLGFGCQHVKACNDENPVTNQKIL